MKTMMSRKAAYAGALALGAMVAMAPSIGNALYVPFISGTLATNGTNTGTLRYTPGTSPWSDTSLAYSVSYEDLGSGNINWKYVYTFTDLGTGSNVRDVSHWILETSPNFTFANVKAGSSPLADTPGVDNPKNQTVGSGNPEMPADVYGLRFLGADNSSVGGQQVTSITLFSDRSPVWGDIYLKDGALPGGNDITVHNSGFTSPDTDPTPNGSTPLTAANWSAILAAVDPAAAFFGLSSCLTPAGCGDHVLTPDTTVVSQVPIPAALPIIGAALAGFGFVGWRQQRKVA